MQWWMSRSSMSVSAPAPARSKMSPSPVQSTVTRARIARRPSLLSNTTPATAPSCMIGAQPRPCSSNCTPLSSTSSWLGEFQPLRIDGRRPGDDAVVRRGAFAPVGNRGLVGAAPQPARRTGDRVLREPIQQVGRRFPGSPAHRSSRSCGRSRSPGRRWRDRPGGCSVPAARHPRRCAPLPPPRPSLRVRRPPPARRSRGTPGWRGLARAPRHQVARGEQSDGRRGRCRTGRRTTGWSGAPPGCCPACPRSSRRSVPIHDGEHDARVSLSSPSARGVFMLCKYFVPTVMSVTRAAATSCKAASWRKTRTPQRDRHDENALLHQRRFER